MKLKELLEEYGDYIVPDEFIEKLEKPETKTVWALQYGDTYYTLDYKGEIDNFEWEGHFGNFDIKLRNQGNIFLTKEEAEWLKEETAPL